MVTRIINLYDGRSIKITASGATPRRYRNITGKEIFDDMDKVTKDYLEIMNPDDSLEESEETIGTEFDSQDQTIIEDVLFVMSGGIIRNPDGKEVYFADTDEMLEAIETRDVFASIADIIMLWMENLGTLEEAETSGEENQKKTAE